MYNLIPTQDNKPLFYSMDGETAERHGVIGHIRADFDSGKMFYCTWFDNQTHLKTPAFKAEFDAVINSLRDDGQKPQFASRANLSAFCYATPGENLGTQGNGYMIRTLDYSYYFRCKPAAGDYDIYCFAYDNRYLLPELAGKHDLPDRCFTLLPSSGELIVITSDESGYVPSESSKHDPEVNRLFADTSNKFFGITKAQEKAMFAGSMFGWNTPAAKPWNYDQNGKPLPMQQKKNEPVR